MRIFSANDNKNFTIDDYKEALRNFDAATCDAIAVSQASASIMELPTVGYSTHIFARMCSYAIMAISAVPKSRWSRREFEHWDISAIAGHARALLEGYLLFWYLAEAPDDEDVQRAYVQTMHMYDFKKRISMNLFSQESHEIESIETTEQEIKSRLESTNTFQNLDKKLQNEILAGKKLMIKPKHEIIQSTGFEQQEFDLLWTFFSQYIHVFSFNFYRIEPNGRNTGLFNQFDLSTQTLSLIISTALLSSATERMVELFPDSASKRQGINSKFSPGPIRNLPKSRRKSQHKRRTRRSNATN